MTPSPRSAGPPDRWRRSAGQRREQAPEVLVEADPDGGVTLHLGPEDPAGKAANWIRAMPNTGWFPIIRLDGPLEPRIARTWKPDALSPMEQGRLGAGS